jgi:hypothetical protein
MTNKIFIYAIEFHIDDQDKLIVFLINRHRFESND